MLIFSLWQIPHSYAIAIFRREDYAAAAIPVLPVQRGMAAARKHIVGFIPAFMAATWMLSLGGYTGFRCLAVSTVFGLFWLHMALKGNKGCSERLWAKKLFLLSLLNLLALSAMMSIDFTAAAGTDRFLSYLP